VPDLPENYKQFLVAKGGVNIFGDPNFILNWGSSSLVRLTVPDEFRRPYQECWALCEWTSPEEFGPPDQWDEKLLGPYPSRGAYNPIQVFREGNVPCQLDSEYLNLPVLEMFLWVILHHKHDSLSKRSQFLKDEFARREAVKTKQMVDRIEDGAPAFLEGVSFSGQLNCNSVVRQKMEQLEKNLDRISDVAKRFPRKGQVQAPSGARFNVNAEV
jgi:hypothetical protein